ncbi:MAG: serine/threonine-protein kinase [Methanoregula sp.]|nr:serine/threonine-protein kinase [Methanoregula sp.]
MAASDYSFSTPVVVSSVAVGSPPTIPTGASVSSLIGLPFRISTPKPTPVPPTPSPSPAAVKRVADRPKVTVPLSLLVILFVFAFGALITVAYLLFRHRPIKPVASREKPTPSPHVTIIDFPAESRPARIPPAEPGLAVQFPPALEKKYLNPEFIGEGGLARVFRAERPKDGVIVAVKVPIRFDEVTGTHFTKDILFWQDLRHKNIIRMYGSNILPLPYIEMEYAPSSLAGMRFPVSEKRACAIIQGVAEGLAYAHAHGIAHRDIKPENILISEDGTPKITDWGLGKSITDTKQSHIIGYSPAYAAPEQLAPHLYGLPGTLTDIYQSGVLLFEMLIGTTPFEQEGVVDMNRAILYKKPQIPVWGGEHEEAIKKILLKCLEKKPADRYDSVNSLIADLAALDTSP